MEYFYIDTSQNRFITWHTLISDLNSTSEYSNYCYSEDFYIIFKNIIISLLTGKNIILLDSDFSQEEIFKLTGTYSIDTSAIVKSITLPKLQSKEELISKIANVSDNWVMTIFTSGTTGLPKVVNHSFKSITRFVRVSDKYKFTTWGFAYNPVHMAGIQVFFQALLNGNCIVRLFGLANDHVFQAIEDCKITSISATPSFYRLLLPHKKSYPFIQHLTSGGEKFDSRLSSSFKVVFPNAKITNVYASTEVGALFASSNNVFTIKEDMKPFVQFKDRELLIHKSLMLNNDFVIGDWYKTGDIVNIISNDPLTFIFVSRKNEMINVGGYKVNPNEVEETIRSIDGIKDARVFSKSNAILGSIICCEIVRTNSNLAETSIRRALQEKLQEHKIPRLITFVDEISKTRTGKIQR